ncbi:GNAT family N-acetyltransferase [Croceivirga radicis]|uniref:GNAT family N-acetyltransferase n=1 Tax=Croceivirga radicis TaxID=1929488 RepID=UPI000255B2C2|nr:GNAT family N-acetyltransferase [Croceivirga radicis]
MFKIITEENEWNKTIGSFEKKDFYHSYDYHQVCLKENELAKLLFYSSGDTSIAFPLVIRPINGSEFFDATSVYGYGGPLISQLTSHFVFQDWNQHMLDFFQNDKIISVFSSTNPFIDSQEHLLLQMGEIETMGDIVYVDLKQGTERREHYSKTTKRYLNRNKTIFDIREGNSEEDARKFLEIYYQSMERVGASKQYYFKLPYFIKLLQNKSFFDANFVFATSKENGDVASGAFIIRTKSSIVQYHLSGTAEKYRHLSPIRSVIDYISRKEKLDDCKYFNLGGGVGSKNDSLFEFKASFSKNRAPFKVWKYIANKEVYDQLCTIAQEKDYNKKFNTNYFPAYRTNSYFDIP